MFRQSFSERPDRGWILYSGNPLLLDKDNPLSADRLSTHYGGATVIEESPGVFLVDGANPALIDASGAGMGIDITTEDGDPDGWRVLFSEPIAPGTHVGLWSPPGQEWDENTDPQVLGSWFASGGTYGVVIAGSLASGVIDISNIATNDSRREVFRKLDQYNALRRLVASTIEEVPPEAPEVPPVDPVVVEGRLLFDWAEYDAFVESIHAQAVAAFGAR